MEIAVRDVTMDHLDSVAPVWEQAWRVSGRRRSSVPLALSMDRMRRRVELPRWWVPLLGRVVRRGSCGHRHCFHHRWRPDDGGPRSAHPRAARRRAPSQPAGRHRAVGRGHRMGALVGFRSGRGGRPAGIPGRGAVVRGVGLRPISQPADRQHRRCAAPLGCAGIDRPDRGSQGRSGPRCAYCGSRSRQVSRPVAIRRPSSSWTGTE